MNLFSQFAWLPYESFIAPDILFLKFAGKSYDFYQIYLCSFFLSSLFLIPYPFWVILAFPLSFFFFFFIFKYIYIYIYRRDTIIYLYIFHLMKT
jgi:hypothetical protein